MLPPLRMTAMRTAVLFFSVITRRRMRGTFPRGGSYLTISRTGRIRGTGRGRARAPARTHARVRAREYFLLKSDGAGGLARQEPRDLAGVRGHLHARRLERAHLRFRRTAPAQHDGPGVTHLLARRRGPPRHIGDHRLPHRPRLLRRLLLRRPANLADEDHSVGARVLVEEV